MGRGLRPCSLRYPAAGSSGSGYLGRLGRTADHQGGRAGTKSINARHLFSGLELLLVTRRARIKVAAEKEILNSANFEPARTVSAAPAGRVCPVERPGPLPGPFEAEHLAAPAWPEAVSPSLAISQYPGARSVSTPARVWSVPRAPRPLVPRHIKVSTPARRVSVPQPHRVRPRPSRPDFRFLVPRPSRRYRWALVCSIAPTILALSLARFRPH